VKLTGERFLPEVSGDIQLEHLHRYAIAAEYVRDKRVLDVASGEGYGSARMATTAASVIGVDISKEAIEFSQQKYQHKNLMYQLGSCAKLPVDEVVSFETNEHHTLHEEMMLEVSRVLTDSGTFIISSPDRSEYSDNRGYQNPYHVKELYKDEFVDLLKRHFKYIKLYGQRVQVSSTLGVLDDAEPELVLNYYGDSGADSGLYRPMYFVAVASNDEPSPLSVGNFELINSETNLDYVSEMFLREQWLKDAKEHLDAVCDNSDKQIRYRDELLKDAKEHLDAVCDNSDKQIRYRDEQLKDAKEHLDAVCDNSDKQISYRGELVEMHEQKILEQAKIIDLLQQKIDAMK
jgi:SAM-dependent methyltransferase